MFEVREVSVRAGDGGVRGVDLYVTAGEVVGLLGDAGGSVLVRAAAGVLAPLSGVVRLDGEDLTNLPGHVVAARGVVLLPRERGVAGALTVVENVVAGAATASAAGARRAATRTARADTVLGWFPALAAAAATPAALLGPDLAGALALAVALAGAPRLLLVDGLLPYVGAAGYPAALAGLRAAAAEGISTVVAEVLPPDVREGDPAAVGVDPGEFDRAFLVARGALRPWFAAARAGDPTAAR